MDKAISGLLLVAFFSFIFIVNNVRTNGVPGFPDTSPTSVFTQTILAGALYIDIVDGTSYVAVASPSVVMGSVNFGLTCQTSTGVFGTPTESIYVRNSDASDSGWVVSLAAGAPTAFWDSAGTDFDFNDPTAAGCTDGGDVDTLGGQMTVDPSVGTLTVGQCSTGCTTANVSLGSSAAFNEGTLDSITILTGAAASDDIGDWKLTGVAVSQTIPAAQPAAADYAIPLTLSIVAT